MAQVAETESDFSVTMSSEQILKQIKEREAKMYRLAKDLEFEAAARIRDEIHRLQEQLIAADAK